MYHVIRDIPDGRRKHKAQSQVLDILHDLKFDLLEETRSQTSHQQGKHQQQEYHMQWTSQGQKLASQQGNIQVISGGQRQRQSNEALGHPSQDWPDYSLGNWMMNRGQDMWGQGPTGNIARHIQMAHNDASQLQYPPVSQNVMELRALPVHTPILQTIHSQDSSSDTISDLLTLIRRQDSDASEECNVEI